MFNWLKRKRSTTEEHELQNTQPPKIRKPTHAARDARMSIPVGEREYYDILEARKRAAGNASPSIGTSAIKGSGKGKEKAHSPLAYNDSCKLLAIASVTTKVQLLIFRVFSSAAVPSSSSTADSSPAFSTISTTSYECSYYYDTDMGEFGDTPTGVARRRHSTAQTSLAESSRDAVAKGAKAKAKKSGSGRASA